MTPRQVTALGTVYTALFGAWFIGALHVHTPSARLFADAGSALALAHGLFLWTTLHWLAPRQPIRDSIVAGVALAAIPLPVYALLVASGGLTWAAVGRLELALVVLLVAGGGLLAAIRRALPDGIGRAATITLQFAPAALLWALRDEWLVQVLA